MLTKNQASQIVRGSIRKAAGSSWDSHDQISNDRNLEFLGISNNESIRKLAITIAADPESGVPSLQHYIDPNKLADLEPTLSVGALTELVTELAAGKLCSHPSTPHEQKCCPYPANCPECGYPVP